MNKVDIDENVQTLSKVQVQLMKSDISMEDFNKASEMIGELKEFLINCDSYRTELNKVDFLFVDVPDIYKNFKIVQYTSSGTYLMETDSKGLNHWKIKIPRGNYEIVGFIDSELTNKNFALKKTN